MSLNAWTIETPVAPWRVVVDGDVVVASGFCSLEELLDETASRGLDLGKATRGDAGGPVAAAVRAYLASDSGALGAVEVRQPGGEFQQHVWAVMRDIPAGDTWSYGQLATKAGRSAATRGPGPRCRCCRRRPS